MPAPRSARGGTLLRMLQQVAAATNVDELDSRGFRSLTALNMEAVSGLTAGPELLPAAVDAVVCAVQLLRRSVGTAAERLGERPLCTATPSGLVSVLCVFSEVAKESVAADHANVHLCQEALATPGLQSLLSLVSALTLPELESATTQLEEEGAAAVDAVCARLHHALNTVQMLLQLSLLVNPDHNLPDLAPVLAQPAAPCLLVARLCAALKAALGSCGGSCCCCSICCHSAEQVNAAMVQLAARRLLNVVAMVSLHVVDGVTQTPLAAPVPTATAELVMMHLAMVAAATRASWAEPERQPQQQQQQQVPVQQQVQQQQQVPVGQMVQEWRLGLPCYHEQLVLSGATWAGLEAVLLPEYEARSQQVINNITLLAAEAAGCLQAAGTLPAPQRMPLLRLLVQVAADAVGDLERQPGVLQLLVAALEAVGNAHLESEVPARLGAAEAAGLLNPVLHVLAPSVLLTLRGLDAAAVAAAGGGSSWALCLQLLLSQAVVWVASAVAPKHLAAAMAQQPLMCCAVLEMAVRTYGTGLLQDVQLPATMGAEQDVLSPSSFAAHVAAACRITCEEGRLASHLTPGGPVGDVGRAGTSAAAAAATAIARPTVCVPSVSAAMLLLHNRQTPAQALQAQLYGLLVSCLKAPAGPGSGRDQDLQTAHRDLQVLRAAYAAQHVCAAASPAAGGNAGGASAAAAPAAAAAAAAAAAGDNPVWGRCPEARHWAALLARCVVAAFRCPAAALALGFEQLTDHAGQGFLAAAQLRCKSDSWFSEALSMSAVVCMFGQRLLPGWPVVPCAEAIWCQLDAAGHKGLDLQQQQQQQQQCWEQMKHLLEQARQQQQQQQVLRHHLQQQLLLELELQLEQLEPMFEQSRQQERWEQQQLEQMLQRVEEMASVFKHQQNKQLEQQQLQQMQLLLQLSRRLQQQRCEAMEGQVNRLRSMLQQQYEHQPRVRPADMKELVLPVRQPDLSSLRGIYASAPALSQWWESKPQGTTDGAALDAWLEAAPELAPGRAWQLAQGACTALAAATGSAGLAGLPLTLACSNNRCANLAGASELHLVEGRPGGVCGGCRLARYCSRACQSDAWPEHKRWCAECASQHRGGSPADGSG